MQDYLAPIPVYEYNDNVLNEREAELVCMKNRHNIEEKHQLCMQKSCLQVTLKMNLS